MDVVEWSGPRSWGGSTPTTTGVAFVLLLSIPSGALRAELRLSEIVAANHLSSFDEYGDASDWFELWNRGLSPMDLDGWSVTNDSRGRRRWWLPPTTLAPDARLVIRASGRSDPSDAASASDMPGLHASFRLSRAAEPLLLLDPEGEFADGVFFPEQTRDHSWGLDVDGVWRYFATPTPGRANAGPSSDHPFSDDITFEPRAGVYAGRVWVSPSTNLPDRSVVRYTLDGSVPDSESPVARAPIRIERTTSVRARAFLGETPITRVVASTWVIAPRSSIPVVALTLDPDAFRQVHVGSGGRGRASERFAHFEYFSAAGARLAEHGAGLRLHGGASRAGPEGVKKSYRLHFRGVYGAAKLRVPIFPSASAEEFDHVVLRAGFNDGFRTSAHATYLRDELVRRLYRDLGGAAPHGSWCVLYVNGEALGLYNPTERITERFLEAELGSDDWDIVKTSGRLESGTLDAWEQLGELRRLRGLAPDHALRRFDKQVDLEDLGRYLLLQLWAQNHDWPQNNWYAVRPRTDDGRWRFIVWDAEFALGLEPRGFSSDSLAQLHTRRGELRDLSASLLSNEGFRRGFLSALDDALAGVLAPAHVLGRIRELRDEVSAGIEAELSRFGRSREAWEESVRDMEVFARGRGPVFLAHVLRSDVWGFAALESRFVPGDVDADGAVDARDAVSLLGGLFMERVELPCPVAADVDRSGSLDVSDAILLWQWLASGRIASLGTKAAICRRDLSSPLGCAAVPACP